MSFKDGTHKEFDGSSLEVLSGNGALGRGSRLGTEIYGDWREREGMEIVDI